VVAAPSASTRFGRRLVAVIHSTSFSYQPRHGGEVSELIDRCFRFDRRAWFNSFSRLALLLQSGQIKIRGPTQPLAEEPERGVEIAVTSCHDQVERRVALIGTEIADAFRHDLQIEVSFLELPSRRRRSPSRYRLVAFLRPPTAVQHQRRHPGVQIGERLVVELTVRVVTVTVAAIAAAVVLVRRRFGTISQRQQRCRDPLGNVGWQRRQLVRP
jgi:hypothetical protein